MAHQFGEVPAGVAVRPQAFTLHVPDNDIDEFKALLKLSRIAPETFENKSGKHGLTRDWLATAKKTWLNHFDWRDHEKRINSYPNFKSTVKDSVHGDITVHFAALFSKKSGAIPVILMHGWPGSFLEYLPILGLFVEKYTPGTLPYHVIVPSLPGYTLSSGPPVDRNFDIDDLTRIMHQFMLDLGFGSRGFIAQGGDIGSFVARRLAAFSECKAVHVNALFHNREMMGAVPESVENLTEDEAAHFERCKTWVQSGNAYSMTQATRPGTIGLILSSSPLALLGWIGEKLTEWVDPHQPLDLDTVLSIVSLYWFTNSYPRSIYPYRNLYLPSFARGFPKTDKPFGYSYAPFEMGFLPIAWGKTILPDLIRYQHDKGGHFVGLEHPSFLLEDLEDFVLKCKHLFP